MPAWLHPGLSEVTVDLKTVTISLILPRPFLTLQLWVEVQVLWGRIASAPCSGLCGEGT